MIFDMIRSQLAGSVPFAKHAGVALETVASGHSTAELPFRPEGLNHIGTQHAAALFLLGETASGAAMAGAFAPVLLQIKPVASEAQIRYLKAATGPVKAEGRVVGDTAELLATLKTAGKVQCQVAVDLTDAASGDKVCEMMVQWHISGKKPSPAQA